jgi:acetoin utilization protein AcuC
VKTKPVFVYKGDALAKYNFGDNHPFGPKRHHVFHDELERLSLGALVQITPPSRASIDQLALFHTSSYIDQVSRASEDGKGFLDDGDTPAFLGVFEAASDVVGTTLAAIDAIMHGQARRAFSPIGGLHHARRDKAGGFCVFNDCGVAIHYLRENYNVQRILYVDIDAHHGDGIFYDFEDDADLLFADIHQDGDTLYPGTGASDETGTGNAVNTKINLSLPPGATDNEFSEAWAKVENYLMDNPPEFIILQCGADSLAGDPITQLNLTEAAHRMAALSLCQIADRHCDGRIIGLGGGGYNLDNIAKAWTQVIRAFLVNQKS